MAYTIIMNSYQTISSGQLSIFIYKQLFFLLWCFCKSKIQGKYFTKYSQPLTQLSDYKVFTLGAYFTTEEGFAWHLLLYQHKRPENQIDEEKK